MPGVAAHMRFDEKTDFAEAIAQLTGLKPLEELGRRSNRVVSRLRTDEKQKTEKDRSEKARIFENAKRAVVEKWQGHTDLGEPPELPSPGVSTGGANCAASIAKVRQSLEQMQQNLSQAVYQILGRGLRTRDEAGC